MKEQDVRGLMASVDVTQDLLFVHHNPCRTAGHCVQMQIQLMTSLENLVQFMVGLTL